MSQRNLEQEARIALMGHFRSYAQYWGTFLLTLAVTLVVLVQNKIYGPVEVFRFGFIVVVTEGFFALTRMFSHARLCLLVVTPKQKPERVNNKQIALTWLYKDAIKELRLQWCGIGRWLDALGNQWLCWTVLSVIAGFVFAFILRLP